MPASPDTLRTWAKYGVSENVDRLKACVTRNDRKGLMRYCQVALMPRFDVWLGSVKPNRFELDEVELL